MQESIVFLVRVQCRRKESSRSLSHLLMSFLSPVRQSKVTKVHFKTRELFFFRAAGMPARTGVSLLQSFFA